jgi:hypothetical protein
LDSDTDTDSSTDSDDSDTDSSDDDWDRRRKKKKRKEKKQKKERRKRREKMKERYEKIIGERSSLHKLQPEEGLGNQLEEIRKEKEESRKEKEVALKVKEEARREKEETQREKEELQRQREEIRGLTAHTKICQQVHTGPLGYDVPGSIHQVQTVQAANIIENKGRGFTGSGNPIVCYNCETPGHPESRCWKSRVPPEIRAENVQRINARSYNLDRRPNYRRKLAECHD